jgi:hypothetical protein
LVRFGGLDLQVLGLKPSKSLQNATPRLASMAEPEDQSFPPCFRARQGDVVRSANSHTGPRLSAAHNEAGQMAVSDYEPSFPKILLASEEASTWKTDLGDDSVFGSSLRGGCSAAVPFLPHAAPRDIFLGGEQFDTRSF